MKNRKFITICAPNKAKGMEINMKNTLKRIVMFTMSTVLTLMAGMTAFASSPEEYVVNEELVSIQEYESTMKEIYSRYGIEWKIIDASNALPITKEVFESEKNRAVREGEKHLDDLEKAQSEVTNLEHISNNLQSENDVGILGFMPITGDYTYLANYKAAHGMVRIRVKTTALYNADYGEFVSFYNTSFQKWAGVNCTGWRDTGTKIGKAKDIFWVSMNGIASFSYTIPTINIVVEDSIETTGIILGELKDRNKTVALDMN